MTPPDVEVRNHGTVWSFRPLTDEGWDWIDEEVDMEHWQWLAGRLVVDRCFGPMLVEAMLSDGLTVPRLPVSCT